LNEWAGGDCRRRRTAGRKACRFIFPSGLPLAKATPVVLPQGAHRLHRRLDLSVYMITDRTLCGARGVLDTVGEAIAGGVTIVQLRDPEAKTRTLIEEARAILGLLRPAKIPFIVNDRVDVALAVDADGVHVGQNDMPVADARRLIGRSRILGLSITSEADLDKADLAAVDYLGVGPIYASPTKPDAAPPMAMGGLRAIARRTKLPIVAIGGLHAGNAEEAIAAGADGIAVVSAICSAADAGNAARELSELVKAARDRSA
jgi:thiamine-phosphate pyrophosphorylase